MVSLKDIAKHCGVSVASVSKALNGQPDISQETRARIEAAARELGYTANSSARALKTNRSYHLGVLFVDGQNSGLAHEHFSSVLESFKVEAESHGYDITFITRNVGGRVTTFLQHCLYRGVDGVMIASVDFNDPSVIELVGSGLPVVTIDHVFNNKLAVVSDNVSGLEAIVEYVWSMGHRKLAFLHGELTSVTQNRLTGFYRACDKLGIEVPEENVIPCRYHDPDCCAKATRRVLELKDMPSCIIFPDDYSYIGGMNVLLEQGLRIPEDISVVGYDGIHLAKVLGLTTYMQDTKALGATAARQLISLIEQPRTTVTDRIVVPGVLYRGSSVRDMSL